MGPSAKIVIRFVVFLLSVLAEVAAAEPGAPILALEAGKPIPAFTGKARVYAATASGDCAKQSFQAEVTLTIKSGHGGNGCAFFGLGKGQANPASYNEPTAAPSLTFRFSPNDFNGGLVTAAINGEAAGEDTKLGDGTHRARLTSDAAQKRAWLEIQPQWKKGEAFKASATLCVSSVNIDFGGDGHLFVGGADGVSFADFSVKQATVAELSKLPVNDSFPRDPSARTWLPVENASALSQSDKLGAPVNDFLKKTKASLRPVVCWYEGAKLLASRALAGGQLRLPNSKWDLALDARPAADDADALDLTLSFTLKDGSVRSAGVAAAFDFADWNVENYVLIPASVYNGNRFRTVGRAYAAGLDRSDLYRKDLPLTQSNVPRLNDEAGKLSKLEVSSCNAATPAICVYDKKAKRGFILLAEQGGRGASADFLRKANGEILDSAFAIEESADRTRATLVVGAPGVREQKPEFIGFSASPDRGIAWKAGDTVKLWLRMYDFAADGIPGLLEKFMTVRKALTGPNQPRNLVPFSEVVRRMTDRIDSRFHNGKVHQFYCPENAEWISFGWIGGMMDTFPMLALGDDKHLDRVSRTFDFAIPAAIGKAGFFYGAINADGKPFGREGYNEHPEICLTRKNADVLYWMIKQFNLLKAQGRGKAIKPLWEDSTKKLADAFVATWKKHGQWGNFVNIDSGDVAVSNTSGGVMAIGGLALASEYFHNAEYLSIAKKAAEFYYQRDFVKLGLTTGACADILQNAESETSFGFAAALMTLYEISDDKQWLEKSRNLANLAATWTVSYDYELPKQTELGRIGAKLAGVVWASTQNKHGAPGICCSSGDSLFKLNRATGDRRYAALIRDIFHAWQEGLRGNQITERLTYCDADSRGSRGSVSNGWCELNGILMAQELPGIYVRTDSDEFFVFDSVDAKVVSRDATGVKVEVRNPTKFDAKVTVLAENRKQAQKPQGDMALLKWPKVDVKSGETKMINIGADGVIQ